MEKVHHNCLSATSLCDMYVVCSEWSGVLAARLGGQGGGGPGYAPPAPPSLHPSLPPSLCGVHVACMCVFVCVCRHHMVRVHIQRWVAGKSHEASPPQGGLAGVTSSTQMHAFVDAHTCVYPSLVCVCQNIFSRQLPKMPREYIVRLVFDRKHFSYCLKKKVKGLSTHTHTP